MRQHNSGNITEALGMTELEKGNFLRNLADVQNFCSQKYNLPVYFHPHCGSRVETLSEIEWLTANSDVKIVFDTGIVSLSSTFQAK